MTLKHLNVLNCACWQASYSLISSCRTLERNFSIFKFLLKSQKYTLQLLPEVETLLEQGAIKHRKHPGVRKLAPIELPETLKNSVYNLISKDYEKPLIVEAEKLCEYLKSRRLPVEIEEIRQRITNMYPAFDGNLEDLPSKMKKSQLIQLKKQIYSELGRCKSLEYNQHECMAYLVGRLDANYSSVCKVFLEIKNQIPTFQPSTFFDFGSGVGSAVWAAHTHWGASIKEYFCVDASAEMNDISYNILNDQEADEMHIKTVFFRQFLPASDTIKYDLVVSAFSLLDLTSLKERIRVIDTLWRKTKDVLVIIEHGNNAGFLSVLDARDYILQIENGTSNSEGNKNGFCSSGAHVLCPCPHDSLCPKFLSSESTCGFHVSYYPLFPRRASRQEKKDWISYVVLRKGCRPKDDVPFPRIVKPVLKKTRHAYCRVCCNDGKLREIIVTKSKHGKHAYRCARSSTLGDFLPVKIMPVTNPEAEEDKLSSDSDSDES